MECQGTVSASRAIKQLFVETSDRALGEYPFYMVCRILVVDDLLVMALDVIGLHPLGSRLDITGVRAEKYFRGSYRLGLLTAKIHLTR